MTVQFAVETFDQIIEDIKQTLEANYNELATYKDIPLKPDYAFYKAGADAGLIRFFSARKGGKLIGYGVFIVRDSHPHYGDQKWATSNLVWVHPSWRLSGVGRGLVAFIKETLVGYVVQICTSVAHPALAMLLASEGFAPVETVHSIRL